MAEAYIPPAGATDTPPVAGEIPTPTPPVETPASGLPSENTPPVEGADFSGFDLTDAQKAQFKDGKFLGRFSNMQDVFDKLKDAEDFRAQQGNQVTVDQKQVDATAAQQTAYDALLPKFIENGMKLTEEMVTEAETAGIDAKDLTIKAYQLREATNKAYDVVGGKERLDTLVTWGKENLPEDVRDVFNQGLGSYSTTKIALEWLEAQYGKAEAEGTTTRISGSPANIGIKPYADQRELFKDKRYIDSPAGKRDVAAVKQYRARLKATPNDVLYGRQ